jgi:hypothetical protein
MGNVFVCGYDKDLYTLIQIVYKKIAKNKDKKNKNNS